MEQNDPIGELAKLNNKPREEIAKVVKEAITIEASKVLIVEMVELCKGLLEDAEKNLHLYGATNLEAWDIKQQMERCLSLMAEANDKPKGRERNEAIVLAVQEVEATLEGLNGKHKEKGK